MKALQNSLVGFAISFVGALPLGYLTVVGYDLYLQGGFPVLWPYLLGVAIVEGLVIYSTLAFANELLRNQKLAKAIEIFSVVFFLVLAFLFFTRDSAQPFIFSNTYNTDFHPLLIGLLLSALNLMQIPFWTGWNLYLLSNNYICDATYLRFFYVIGAMTGTVVGIAVLIFILDQFSQRNNFFQELLFNFVMPILFLGMAVFQSWKLIRK